MTAKRWPVRTNHEYRQEAHDALGSDVAQILGRVKAMVFDADGILTPGYLIYGPKGEAFKEFHSRDGLGLVMAGVAGIKLAVLTGRQSEIVARRAAELRFDAVRLGRFDKVTALSEILTEIGGRHETTLFMGDDLIDLPAMFEVAAPVSVPEAPEEVRQHSCFVTEHHGGRGAVREVIDWVLKCQGLFGTVLNRLADQAWARNRGGGP